MFMDFRDRHVIVTGGTGALGTAVVGGLLAHGAICHVPYRNEAAARLCPHRDNARAMFYPQIELTDENSVARLFAAVPKLWASIHVAGGFAAGPLGQTEKTAFAQQLDTNLLSCLLCCRAAVNAFSRSGGGRIVNVAARPALEWRQGSGMAAYAAAKAGVAALTSALAEEVAGVDILVNAVAPSIIDTPANRKAMPTADHAKWPKAEEVAATILFLASPDNKVTRGAIVPVYGMA
jgi:NAD(P)-dependent dehydrogenase (short-subunit alcohol dehydrogenase family)